MPTPKTETEFEYRFVLANGYTHDFWFTNLETEWDESVNLTSLDWKQSDRVFIRSSPHYIKLSQIVAIIQTGLSREVLVDETD